MGRAMITSLTKVSGQESWRRIVWLLLLLSSKWKSNDFRKSKVIYVWTSYHARKID